MGAGEVLCLLRVGKDLGTKESQNPHPSAKNALGWGTRKTLVCASGTQFRRFRRLDHRNIGAIDDALHE